MWRFCTMSKRDIASFAFDIFDRDDSNTLSLAELTNMIAEVYGKKGLNEQLKKVIRTLDGGKDGVITKKDFIDHADKFPALLFPAFSMQVKYSYNDIINYIILLL